MKRLTLLFLFLVIGSLLVLSFSLGVQNDQEVYKEKQLIGRWFYLSRDSESRSKTENLIEGKFIKLTKKHRIDSDLLEDWHEGEWRFEEEDQLLIFAKEGLTIEWELERVNDFGMVLIEKETKEKWLFAKE